MERSKRRRHSDWAKEERNISEWLPHIEEILSLSSFASSVNDQLWAIGGFLKYRATLDSLRPTPPSELVALEERFCQLTYLPRERYLSLLDMPTEDPVEQLADIRCALKATHTNPTPALPGDELYPHNNFIGQYLQYTRETSAPIAYHFWFAVALLGAACRRNIYFQRDYRLYPNQYLFIIGDTAEGKGIAFSKATPLMWRANEVVQRDMEKKEVDLGPLTGGAYPHRKIVVLPEKPTPQWLVSALIPQDGHVEHTEAIFRGTDSVGWLANEEVSSWLGRKGDVYEGCVNIITAFYNCERDWSAGTHARGAEHLRNMCLSVMCGSNLEWINKSVTPDMFAGGFIRRCMFIARHGAPKRQFLDQPPPPLDPLLANAMAEQMATWMQLEEPLEVEISESTSRLYSKFNRGVEEQKKHPEDSRMYYYYHGKYNFVMKLAIVLAVNRYTWPGMKTQQILESMGHIPLNAEDLELAIELVEHEEQYLPDCFARIGEHAHAMQYRKILEIVTAYNINKSKPITRSGSEGLGKRCLSRGLGSDWSKRTEEMVDIGMLRIGKAKVKSGRPPVCYWNPEVLSVPTDNGEGQGDS